MPPKKNVENPLNNIQYLKPKRGVRKKLPNAKFMTAEKLNTSSIVDSSVLGDCDKIPENITQKCSASKYSKMKPGNKVYKNGIKPVKACKAVTEAIADLSPKNIKTTSPKKKNKNEKKLILTDEVISEPYNPEPVSPRNKKTKVTYRSKQNETKKMQGEGDTDISPKSEDVSSKVNKAKPIRKQRQKKIKMIIAKEGNTHATAGEMCDSPDDEPPKNKKAIAANKQSPNEIKIMLANEVIRNAFKKKPKLMKKQTQPNRPKKIIIENENNEPTKVMECCEHIPDVAKKKGVKYACRRKRPLAVPLKDPPHQLAAITNESCVTEEIPKKRKKPSIRQTMLPPVTEQMSLNTDTVKEGKETIQECAPIIPITCNSTLYNSNESTAPDSTTKINCETHIPKPNNISCRRNSATSTSTCLSWTKDISSSSAVTCVTVKSGDFVRIDKKIPVVRLTNVDYKIKKQHCTDNIFEENSFDSHQNKTKAPSECSSVSITDLNLSQTLNLSTSSLTSVTTNRTAQNNCVNKESKDRIIKLQRSLENLSCKMKKFDLEIINWIGYENESKNANTKNIHHRMFTILNDENQVIKYCEEIKLVLAEDKCNQQASEVRDQCPSDIKVRRLPEHQTNLTQDDQSKDVLDNTDKLNEEKIERKTENGNDEDANIIVDRSELFKQKKSLDKDIDIQDNDDDDALSLYAESITGLESSRKNSSFAVSDTEGRAVNDKSSTRPDLRESLRVNQRLCQPIINIEKNQRGPSYEIINNIEKQTADSSTVCDRTNDILIRKSQVDDMKPVNVCDRLSDRFKVQNGCDNSYNNIQNANVANFKFNTKLFGNSVKLHDIPDMSLVDLSENTSNRSNENYIDKTFLNSNDSCNSSENVKVKADNWNNRPSEIQGDTSRESFYRAENNKFAMPGTLQLEGVNKQMHFVGSNIFKGVCIFNLVSTCRNKICNFSHIHIDINFVRSKLIKMLDEMFIRETVFLLKWPVLLRKYGMCFVEECIRRNMTLWLLHIVKDFLSKLNRKTPHIESFSIEIIEATLLHLNDASIEPCAEILRSIIRPNICLCDHFMKVLSETQNFSRFKNVFIKLTNFICLIGRSFELDVATQVLERLCILPYDESLARALIKIVEKTNSSIFGIPMMGLLENQLAKHNVQMYKELISLKVQTEGHSQNLVSPPTQSPRIASSNIGHQTSVPIVRADSPDTTNTDSVKNMAEPVITRTITINRTINTSILNVSAGSESSEEPAKNYEGRKIEQSWRNRRPNLSMRPQRQVYNRLGFIPRTFNGNLPTFRRKPPRGKYYEKDGFR